MSKNTLRHTLTEVATEVLGRDAVYHGLYTAKLKDGTRVYRITGSSHFSPGHLYKLNDKIWLAKGDNQDSVHITKEIAEGDYQRHDLNFCRWEWHLLDKGLELVTDELETAIRASGGRRRLLDHTNGGADDRRSRLRNICRASASQPSGPADHDLCGIFPRTPTGALCRGQGSVPGLLLGGFQV
jgi:hypothetical protein